MKKTNHRVIATIFILLLLSTIAVFRLHALLKAVEMASGPVTLEGTVVSEPERSRTYYGEKRARFYFRACDTNAKILAAIYGAAPQIEFGSRIRIRGELSQPSAPSNPGEFDYKWHLKTQGIHHILTAKSRDVENLCVGKINFLLRAVSKIRRKAKELIDKNLAQPYAAMLSALLLGERSQIPDDLNDSFMKTGTIHVLAISGLHVGLLSFLFLTLLKALRFPRRACCILCICLLAFYAVLVGARSSVVRATIMIMIYLFAELLGREPNHHRSLFIAALLVLSFNPLAIFQCDFLLSFASVFSILCFAPGIQESLRKIPGFLCSPLSVSLSAWLGVLPVVAWFFNIVTPVAIVANLIIVPLSSAAIAEGLALVTVGTLIPFFGKVFAHCAQLLLYLTTRICEHMSGLPYAFIWISRPSSAQIVLYYAVLFLWAGPPTLKLRRAGPRRPEFFQKLYLKPQVAALLILNLFIWPTALQSSGGDLSVTFLSTGSSDAALVELPDGRAVLVDTGKEAAGNSVVKPFLSQKGIRRLNAVILTHPDSDHIGGAATVLENFKVSRVFDNGRSDRTRVCSNLKNAAAKKRLRRTSLKEGDEIRFRDVKVLVLNPIVNSRERLCDNDESLVLKFVYKDVSFLLCGDVQENGLRNLLVNKECLRADVIKVPHHGAYVEGIGQLLACVKPNFAVITVARNGRPKRKLMNILESAGAKVLTTAESGAITISTDGHQICISEFL